MPFDGTNLTKTQRLLIRARNRIENGWCQNHLTLKGKTEFCMIGALGVTNMGARSAVQNSAMAWLSQAIVPNPIYPVAVRETIIHYNNFSLRTKEEVLATFDKAISLAMEK